jgi:hypothetical protein
MQLQAYRISVCVHDNLQDERERHVSRLLDQGPNLTIELQIFLLQQQQCVEQRSAVWSILSLDAAK